MQILNGVFSSPHSTRAASTAASVARPPEAPSTWAAGSCACRPPPRAPPGPPPPIVLRPPRQVPLCLVRLRPHRSCLCPGRLRLRPGWPAPAARSTTPAPCTSRPRRASPARPWLPSTAGLPFPSEPTPQHGRPALTRRAHHGLCSVHQWGRRR